MFEPMVEPMNQPVLNNFFFQIKTTSFRCFLHRNDIVLLRIIRFVKLEGWIQTWKWEVTREPLYHCATILIILYINKIIYCY